MPRYTTPGVGQRSGRAVQQDDAITIATVDTPPSLREGATYEASSTALQRTLNDAMVAHPGQIIKLLPGTFRHSDLLKLLGHGITLRGSGMGRTTIKPIDNYAPTLSGWYGGSCIVNEPTPVGQTRDDMAIEDLTIDQNAGNWDAASYGRPNAHAISLRYGIRRARIRRVEVINPIKYGIHLLDCVDCDVEDNRVITGTLAGGLAAGYVEQDGIHLDAPRRCRITRNRLDTGGFNTGGDDAIAILCWSDLADADGNDIEGNIIAASGHAGIALYCQDGKVVKNTRVRGNILENIVYTGLKLGQYGSGGVFKQITFEGNKLRAVAKSDPADVSGPHAAMYIQGHPTAGQESHNGCKFIGTEVDGIGTSSVALRAHVGLFARGRRLHVIETIVTDWPGDDAFRLEAPIDRARFVGNDLDLSVAVATAKAFRSVGLTRGILVENSFKGQAASGAGINLRASATAPSTDNLVCLNAVTGFGAGIVESSDGANPDWNRYRDNNLRGNTAATTLLGTDSVAADNVF